MVAVCAERRVRQITAWRTSLGARPRGAERAGGTQLSVRWSLSAHTRHAAPAAPAATGPALLQ